MSNFKAHILDDERDRVAAFLKTLSDLELVVVQYDARKSGDEATLQAVHREFAARAKPKSRQA